MLVGVGTRPRPPGSSPWPLAALSCGPRGQGSSRPAPFQAQTGHAWCPGWEGLALSVVRDGVPSLRGAAVLSGDRSVARVVDTGTLQSKMHRLAGVFIVGWDFSQTRGWRQGAG